MSLKTAILWNLSTVIVAACVAWVAARASSGKNEPVSHSHHHHHSDDEKNDDFHQWLHENLDITSEQDRVLHAIEEKYSKTSEEQEREILEAGNALAAAIRNHPADPGSVEKALERLHRAQVELQRTTLAHFFEMKEHLSPEQGEKLLQWTHDSIIHGHEH